MSDRFWSKVNKIPNGCWEWVASTSQGYGQFYSGKKLLKAHRFSWELVNNTIPDGMRICHHCDNRKCVKPSHLFLGTDSDNMQDCLRKGRKNNPKGERHGTAKLTDEKVLLIRKKYSTNKFTYAQLANEFGVTGRTIGSVVTRKKWRHV